MKFWGTFIAFLAVMFVVFLLDGIGATKAATGAALFFPLALFGAAIWGGQDSTRRNSLPASDPRSIRGLSTKR